MLVPYILMSVGFCLCVTTLVSLLHGRRTLSIFTMVLGLASGITGGALLLISLEAAGVSA